MLIKHAVDFYICAPYKVWGKLRAQLLEGIDGVGR